MKGSIMAVLFTLATPVLAGNHGMLGDWQEASGEIDLSRYKIAWADEFKDASGIGRDGDATAWHVGVHSILRKGERYAPPNDSTAYSVADGVLTMTAQTGS